VYAFKKDILQRIGGMFLLVIFLLCSQGSQAEGGGELGLGEQVNVCLLELMLSELF
jgi:hypothetical protein